MCPTVYHAKYFAHELTKRCASDSVEKLAGALSDAQVDLNPHQIEAALFAFRSPLSRGAILADEVGLGKTIEAGILLSQKWTERKSRLLVICPGFNDWGRRVELLREDKPWVFGVAPSGNMNFVRERRHYQGARRQTTGARMRATCFSRWSSLP